ncbi:MAG: hypothetical protein ABWZ90_13995, partial [Acidimicrobiales bacterium]
MVDGQRPHPGGVGDLELAHDPVVLGVQAVVGHDPHAAEVVFGPLGERRGHGLGHGRRLQHEPAPRAQEARHLAQKPLDPVDGEVPEAVAHAESGVDL